MGITQCFSLPGDHPQAAPLSGCVYTQRAGKCWWQREALRLHFLGLIPGAGGDQGWNTAGGWVGRRRGGLSRAGGPEGTVQHPEPATGLREQREEEGRGIVPRREAARA